MYYVPLVLWNSITSLPRLYALACLWRGKEFLYPEKKNKLHECDISKSTIHARESQKKKLTFCSSHLTLTHIGHRKGICLEHLVPLSKCRFTISAKASIKRGSPLSDSARLMPGCFISPIISRSSS